MPLLNCSQRSCAIHLIASKQIDSVLLLESLQRATTQSIKTKNTHQFSIFNLPAFSGSDAGVVWPCELCPFTFKSDFPRKPNRISISVGYGRRRSPCCHVSGAEIAFDALILCEWNKWMSFKVEKYQGKSIPSKFVPICIFDEFFRSDWTFTGCRDASQFLSCLE